VTSSLSDFGCGLLGLLKVDIADRYRHSFPGTCLGGGLADAAGGSGDRGNMPVECSFVRHLFWSPLDLIGVLMCFIDHI